MKDKIDIPENIQNICREFAEVARKNELRDFSLEFNPSDHGWGGKVHCRWEWGRHGDDMNLLKITSSFFVNTHAVINTKPENS